MVSSVYSYFLSKIYLTSSCDKQWSWSLIVDWSAVSGQLPAEFVCPHRFWIFCDITQNESFFMSFLEHLTHKMYTGTLYTNLSCISLFHFAKNILLLLLMCHVFHLRIFFPHHNATYSEQNLWFENTVTRDQAQKGWNSHTKHIMWHNGTIERLFCSSCCSGRTMKQFQTDR